MESKDPVLTSKNKILKPIEINGFGDFFECKFIGFILHELKIPVQLIVAYPDSRCFKDTSNRTYRNTLEYTKIDYIAYAIFAAYTIVIVMII